MDNIKRMADEHARWFTRSMSRIMDGVYRDAFVHGAKHAMEGQEDADDLQDQLDAMTAERERLAADLDRQRAEGEKAWIEIHKAGWQPVGGTVGVSEGVRWVRERMETAVANQETDAAVFRALLAAGIDGNDGTRDGWVRAIEDWANDKQLWSKRARNSDVERSRLTAEVDRLQARVRELEGRK